MIMATVGRKPRKIATAAELVNLRFARAYLANGGDRNAAVLEANPASATWTVKSRTTRASTLLKTASVQAELARLELGAINHTIVTRARVITEVARAAFFDPRRLFDDDGNMIDPGEWSDEIASAVASLEVSERGDVTTTKVKLVNKDSALDKLMKHLGLYELDNEQANPVATNLEQLPLPVQEAMATRLAEIVADNEAKTVAVVENAGETDT